MSVRVTIPSRNPGMHIGPAEPEVPSDPVRPWARSSLPPPVHVLHGDAEEPRELLRAEEAEPLFVRCPCAHPATTPLLPLHDARAQKRCRAASGSPSGKATRVPFTGDQLELPATSGCRPTGSGRDVRHGTLEGPHPGDATGRWSGWGCRGTRQVRQATASARRGDRTRSCGLPLVPPRPAAATGWWFPVRDSASRTSRCDRCALFARRSPGQSRGPLYL